MCVSLPHTKIRALFEISATHTRETHTETPTHLSIDFGDNRTSGQTCVTSPRQHNATHFNTLPHTATPYNISLHPAIPCNVSCVASSACCSVLQRTAAYCNTRCLRLVSMLQHTETHCSTLQHTLCCLVSTPLHHALFPYTLCLYPYILRDSPRTRMRSCAS